MRSFFIISILAFSFLLAGCITEHPYAHLLSDDLKNEELAQHIYKLSKITVFESSQEEERKLTKSQYRSFLEDFLTILIKNNPQLPTRIEQRPLYLTVSGMADDPVVIYKNEYDLRAGYQQAMESYYLIKKEIDPLAKPISELEQELEKTYGFVFRKVQDPETVPSIKSYHQFLSDFAEQAKMEEYEALTEKWQLIYVAVEKRVSEYDSCGDIKHWRATPQYQTEQIIRNKKLSKRANKKYHRYSVFVDCLDDLFEYVATYSW